MARKIAGRHPSPATTRFATTHWTIVLAAGERGDPRAPEAFEHLCRDYWYPLYAYVRRRGYPPDDAEDLTQEFFARLLARNDLARADPQKGRFRSFLLAGMNYLLSDERDRANRLKRGGGQRPLSLDEDQAERRYRREPVDADTPERVFERAWVATLLERASRRLRDEYIAAGKADVYEHLTEFRIDSANEQRAYADVAARLGQSESAIKSSIRRLRQRHHRLVRDEIARTVADAADVADEIRYLLRMADER